MNTEIYRHLQENPETLMYDITWSDPWTIVSIVMYAVLLLVGTWRLSQQCLKCKQHEIPIR